MELTDTAKHALVYRYIQHLDNTMANSHARGCNISGVIQFVENAPSLTKRGWKHYSRQFADDIAYNPYKRDAALDFLAFIGKGYGRKRLPRKVKTLTQKVQLGAREQVLLRDYAHWLKTECDLSPATHRSRIDSVRLFLSYADTLTADTARRYIATLQERGLKPKSINTRIAGLNSLAIFLKKPIKLKHFKIPRSLNLEAVPTREEYENLLAYLKKKGNTHWYLIVKLLATTGARVSEFLQFQWQHVLDGEVVLVGKGGKYRRFFFNQAVQDEVRAYLKENPSEGLIAMNRYGNPISSRGFGQQINILCVASGMPKEKGHPHAFRHFFAKMFIKKNNDISALADVLGHSGLNTTHIYLQKSYDEQKRDYNRIVTW